MKFGFATTSLIHVFLLSLILSSSAGLMAQEKSLKDLSYQRVMRPQSPEDLYLGMQYYDSISGVHLNESDTTKVIFDLRMVIIAAYKMGDYQAAEKAGVHGLHLIDASANAETLKEPRSALYNSLGMVYNELLDYSSARNAYENALKNAQNARDSLIMINNIGNTYQDTKQFEKAIEYYERALQLELDEASLLYRLTAVDNLGRMYSAVNNPKAIDLLETGLLERKALGYLEGIYASYKSLAMHWNRKDKKALALQYADSALATAQKLNSPAFVRDAYSLQIDLGNNNVAAAYKKINDSISAAKQQADNRYAALKYNIEQERRSTEGQKLQKEREKKLRLFFQGMLVLLVVSGVFAFYYFRNKQRLKLVRQVHSTESEISKKVHDEVANEVYGVMTRLQGQNTTTNDLVDHLEHIYNKTRDISREHNPIDPDEAFEEILKDLILPFQTNQRNIITKNTAGIDWKKVPPLKKTALYRVLQELLINTKKHSEATLVAISFNQIGKKIHVDYADNGLGTSLKKRGGLLNTETRIKSLGGKITFETSPNKGFKTKIEL